jgi:hypothetical protein
MLDPFTVVDGTLVMARARFLARASLILCSFSSSATSCFLGRLLSLLRSWYKTRCVTKY